MSHYRPSQLRASGVPGTRLVPENRILRLDEVVVPHVYGGTVDATSGWTTPADAAEWTDLLTGTGIATPSSLWGFQEAAGSRIDDIGDVDLSAAMGYLADSDGWSRKAASQFETAGDACINVAHASLPNLFTTSMTTLVIEKVLSAPAANRSTTNFGPGGSHDNNVEVQVNDSRFFIIRDGTNTGTGVTDHGDDAVIEVLRYNSTAETTDLFVNDEKISKDFIRPADGSKGIWFGAVYGSAPFIHRLYAVAWYGSDAELTDEQVATVVSLLRNGN